MRVPQRQPFNGRARVEKAGGTQARHASSAILPAFSCLLFFYRGWWWWLSSQEPPCSGVAAKLVSRSLVASRPGRTMPTSIDGHKGSNSHSTARTASGIELGPNPFPPIWDRALGSLPANPTCQFDLWIATCPVHLLEMWAKRKVYSTVTSVQTSIDANCQARRALQASGTRQCSRSIGLCRLGSRARLL
jgi:hypothetical protein